MLDSPVPIFIITRDRIEVLKKAIDSYCSRIITPIEIVIHDNSSTYPPLKEYLRELEKSGIRVYRNPGNDLNDAGRTIHDYMSKSPSKYYVVTDPDIVLKDAVPGDILEFLASMLETFKVPVAGPMIQVDDIPNHFPLRQIVHARWNLDFGSRPRQFVDYKNRRIEYILAVIDTTFGMYRREFYFQRYNAAFRSFEPYMVRHLDWYVHPKKLTDDQIYYGLTGTRWNHWSLAKKP